MPKVELAQRSWKRRFLNFVNVFSLFRYYLPLEKGGALHLNKFESPSPMDTLCKVFGGSGSSGEKYFLGHLNHSGDLLLWVGVRRGASCVVRRLLTSSS